MPSGLFEAYSARLEALRAERLLDAAQAATAQYAGREWWDRLVAAANGLVSEVKERARVLFTWNKQPVYTSQGLRTKFQQGVSGARVES